MKDKKLDHNIKRTEEFIEIWQKFHGIFRSILSENQVDRAKEEEFLSVKDLLNSRYEDLMDALDVRPLKRTLVSRPVYDILALDGISIISDERLEKVKEDWRESARFLTGILSRLKRKKERIEGYNRLFFEVKKRVKRRKRR